MVTGVHTVFSCATNFLNGRKCVFCGSFKTVKTARGYVKCTLGAEEAAAKFRGVTLRISAPLQQLIDFLKSSH